MWCFFLSVEWCFLMRESKCSELESFLAPLLKMAKTEEYEVIASEKSLMGCKTDLYWFLEQTLPFRFDIAEYPEYQMRYYSARWFYFIVTTIQACADNLKSYMIVEYYLNRKTEQRFWYQTNTANNRRNAAATAALLLSRTFRLQS